MISPYTFIGRVNTSFLVYILVYIPCLDIQICLILLYKWSTLTDQWVYVSLLRVFNDIATHLFEFYASILTRYIIIGMFHKKLTLMPISLYSLPKVTTCCGIQNTWFFSQAQSIFRGHIIIVIMLHSKQLLVSVQQFLPCWNFYPRIMTCRR